MKNTDVTRDERTISVENSGYRWGYLFLAFGILVLSAYRGLVQQAASWDLLALVILSGVVTTLYQGSHRVLSGRWTVVVLGTVIIAAFLAAGITILK